MVLGDRVLGQEVAPEVAVQVTVGSAGTIDRRGGMVAALTTPVDLLELEDGRRISAAALL
ncbi:MAG: hypothetical protein J2P39_14860 [Candidatus Dormibacteraeota bacterium]|nr:hypothetical protein [Candidatus Dormibacteraeota bacterium]